MARFASSEGPGCAGGSVGWVLHKTPLFISQTEGNRVGIGNTTDFILFLFSTPFYFPIPIFGPRFDSPDLPQSLSNWSGGHNLLFLCFWFRNLSLFRLLLSSDFLLSFVSTMWTPLSSSSYRSYILPRRFPVPFVPPISRFAFFSYCILAAPRPRTDPVHERISYTM